MTALEASIRVIRTGMTVEVALSVRAGETLAVMGPSGAGKSTLLAALAGLAPLAAGEIRVGHRLVDRLAPASRHSRTRAFGRGAGNTAPDARGSADAPHLARARVRGERGRGVHVAPMRRGVVLLGQDARLFPHLSARENVAFGPRVAGTPAARARENADLWLERVGLGGLGHRRPAALSGGQQQRVAVARALAAGPRVVLLDEPLVGLDPQTAGEIRGMLRTQLAGVTTVAVTHDAADAAALGDRLLVIEEGRVAQEGDVAAVLAAPATAFIAAVSGRNRVPGTARAGAWERDGVRLTAADGDSRRAAAVDGAAVAAVFRAADVRLAAAAGANTWRARVDRVEPTPTGVRVVAGWCVAEVEAAAATGLAAGASVRLTVPPAAVRLLPEPA